MLNLLFKEVIGGNNFSRYFNSFLIFCLFGKFRIVWSILVLLIILSIFVFIMLLVRLFFDFDWLNNMCRYFVIMFCFFSIDKIFYDVGYLSSFFRLFKVICY